jgi:hypothetical protein
MILQPFDLPGQEFFELAMESRENILPLSHHTKLSFFENRGIGISVYAHNVLGGGHTGHMLTCSGNCYRNIELRGYSL